MGNNLPVPLPPIQGRPPGRFPAIPLFANPEYASGNGTSLAQTFCTASNSNPVAPSCPAGPGGGAGLGPGGSGPGGGGLSGTGGGGSGMAYPADYAPMPGDYDGMTLHCGVA